MRIGGILFLSCLFVYLSVCLFVRLFVCLLSTLTFAITFDPYRYRLYIWHAYYTNDAFSIDTKADDLVTLTLTLKPSTILKPSTFTLAITFDPYYFYAPGSNDRGYIVFVLSVCLSVCLLSTIIGGSSLASIFEGVIINNI